MLIRRGLQIARRGYRERGLGGLISDLGSLVKSIWFASLNRPISTHGVSIHGTRQFGILQTAEIIAGRYEQAEAEFGKEYISDETSVVEFGGGIGYVTALINQTHKIDQHIVLEMNPEIIPVFRNNMNKTMSTHVSIHQHTLHSMIVFQLILEKRLKIQQYCSKQRRD
jgi:hypothetical protein